MKLLIDQAAHQLSADNTELACAYIQKTAVEKVVTEMEKRLNEVSLVLLLLYILNYLTCMNELWLISSYTSFIDLVSCTIHIFVKLKISPFIVQAKAIIFRMYGKWCLH